MVIGIKFGNGSFLRRRVAKWVNGCMRPIRKSSFTSNGHCEELFDVIVVGGGHAGTEACSAAARMGARTLLVTHKKETIGEMSCNPSFGGIGKGHLMREIDALDGVCARLCDISGVQYKILNRSKGPAVWGLRAQIDRYIYKKNVQNELFNTPNLSIKIATVEDLIIEKCVDDNQLNRCSGIILGNGTTIRSKCVIMTTGTFLRANINIGLSEYPAGRLNDKPAIGLADTLQRINFKIGRLKTGTPPRIDGRTINYAILQEMKGDNSPTPFSFMNDTIWIKPEDQLSCYLTHTNEIVEKLILENLHVNRHVREEVRGPRYCPSIESKAIKFGGRAHTVWLEPEGFDTDVVYPNGLSCTMPEELQVKLINSIRGLENATVLRSGYGVEYEFVDPREVKSTLETKKVDGLFFAGQINGTTGYEEAASQGILAGINAAAKSLEKVGLTISRTEGYIGVLVDDLTTLGTNEPYRMFTARSEFRMSLRPDNADARLTEKGYKVGCVSEARYEKFKRTNEEVERSIDILKSFAMTTNKWQKMTSFPVSGNGQLKSAFNVISIYDDTLPLEKLLQLFPDELAGISRNPRVWEKITIQSLYENAIEKQTQFVEEIRRDEMIEIPTNIDYSSKFLGLSLEEIEKLQMTQPPTIAAASRIIGITPVSLLRILHYVKSVQQLKERAQVLNVL